MPYKKVQKTQKSHLKEVRESGLRILVVAEKAKDYSPNSELMSGTLRRPLMDDLRDLLGLYCDINRQIAYG